jgi:carbonic anhydrase/acetyltransferase-like protein (isoleucine patch superfamily)
MSEVGEGGGGARARRAGGLILPFGGHSPRIDASAWIAPTATVIGNVTIAARASVWFGAVIRGDDPDHPIHIGACTSVQDNAVVHVSEHGATLIGADVTIGHGAVMESCTIGDGALVGMNAVVLQGARVGAGAIVAAGAVVAIGADIPDGYLAAGAPAVLKKELPAESRGWVQRGVDHYVELSRKYLASQGGPAE